MNFRKLFSVPMWGAVACLVILLVAYPGGRQPVVEPVGSTPGAEEARAEEEGDA